MKITTKISKLERNIKAETTFMLSFIFPCGKNGQQIEDEKEPCITCNILSDCTDYYASSPNQNGKVLTFKDFLRHRKNNIKRNPKTERGVKKWANLYAVKQ